MGETMTDKRPQVEMTERADSCYGIRETHKMLLVKLRLGVLDRTGEYNLVVVHNAFFLSKH